MQPNPPDVGMPGPLSLPSPAAAPPAPAPPAPSPPQPSPPGDTARGRAVPGAPGPHRPRLGIALIAAAAFGIEMAVSARYGYQRDELYFLVAGRHPAAGYVDQPPVTPLLARASAGHPAAGPGQRRSPRCWPGPARC
jgi:hypothetical protein